MLRRPLPPERRSDLPPGLEGLSSAAVDARRRRYGSNDVVEAAAHPWRDLLRATAADPMLWFLLGTSGLFAVIGDTTEALVLLAALVPFIGMDIFLHWRTQASIEGLRSRLASEATVLRDGSRQLLPAASLVPGDLAEVAAGALFPADGILLAGEGVQADESSLTGESWPVRKAPLIAGGDPGTAAEGNWVFAGTRVLTGTAQVRIAYTGRETLYGEIVRSATSTGASHAAAARHRHPGRGARGGRSRPLRGAASVRIAQGHGIVDALVSAVRWRCALPEEFPVVFTFFLGVGVYRLARKQALVRRAVVVESIGRVSTHLHGQDRHPHRGPAARRPRAAGHGPRPRRCPQAGGAGVPARRPAIRWTWPSSMPPARRPGAADALATFPFTEDRKRETVIVRAAGGVLAVTLAVTKGAPETIARPVRRWQRRPAAMARAGGRPGRGPATRSSRSRRRDLAEGDVGRRRARPGIRVGGASSPWRTRCAPTFRDAVAQCRGGRHPRA